MAPHGCSPRPAASLPLFWSPTSTADPSHSLPAAARRELPPPPPKASGPPCRSGPRSAGLGLRQHRRPGCGHRAPLSPRGPGRPSLPSPPPLTSFGLSSGANRLIQGNGRAREPRPAARRGAAGRSARSGAPVRGAAAEGGGGRSDPPHGQPGPGAAPRHFCFPRRRRWCILGAQRAAAPPRRPRLRRQRRGRARGRRGGRTRAQPEVGRC